MPQLWVSLMGSRIILPYGTSGNYIQKAIPTDENIKGINFPSLDEYYDDKNSLYSLEKDFPIWNAIEQQYQEWYNWRTTDEDVRKFIAPIVDSSYDNSGLPILCFPRFKPLVDEALVYEYNEVENLVILGMRAQELGVREVDLINFLRDLNWVCDCLELNIDDIIKNPSNIGFHSDFGLRIIDYGLN